MSKKGVSTKHTDPMDLDAFNVADKDDFEEDEEKEFDLVAVMNEMEIGERRKVYALKGLLNDFKSARSKFCEELALLQIEHMRAIERLHEVRAAIVSGLRDVTDDEIAATATEKASAAVGSGVCDVLSSDDGENDEAERKKAAAAVGGGSAKTSKLVKVVAPQEETSRFEAAATSASGGIPDFWLTAMCNAEVLNNMITERDRPALSYLQDISVEYVDGDPRKGTRLNFLFAPNEYFTNTTLSKTFYMVFDEDSGELEIESMKATPIEWKSPEKNLTVIIKTKKQRHKTTKSIRVVKREEKCPSFFNFFTNPLGDDEETGNNKSDAGDDDNDGAKKGKNKHDGAMDDEDDEDKEAMAEEHVEIGQLLMEEIVPKAAFYYTGKSVDKVATLLSSQLDIRFDCDNDDDDDDDDDDEDEDEEEEEEEEEKKLARGSRGRHVNIQQNDVGCRKGSHCGKAQFQKPKNECKQQ